MSQRTLMVCFFLAATVTSTSSLAFQPAARPMSLVDFVARSVMLIPGNASSIQEAFGTAGGAERTPKGWRYAAIQLHTTDDVTLEVNLVSEWDAKKPDVVRLVATVDGRQCVDAAKVRADLTRMEHVEWTPIGVAQGWSATIQGRFVALSQRTGRCLAGIVIDTRRQPRAGIPTRPLRMGPSGRPESVPIPGR
ncbi:hypothetical protein [Luteibacter aegosomatissinici]|uniref:hypothetical protein n=1 Tax=Luteibacter aegosomatissinici TaxID=2911539 RepID=UPI001FF84B64|nr:hypothetical protein [Luteibacter aegosomatissinici]UPG92639.1 hypothetical protein L2Y97_12250 [Luteibacter aegosomatissinici]